MLQNVLFNPGSAHTAPAFATLATPPAPPKAQFQYHSSEMSHDKNLPHSWRWAPWGPGGSLVNFWNNLCEVPRTEPGTGKKLLSLMKCHISISMSVCLYLYLSLSLALSFSLSLYLYRTIHTITSMIHLKCTSHYSTSLLKISQVSLQSPEDKIWSPQFFWKACVIWFFPNSLLTPL